jgi:DNA replicative helicase MCM subunit Mcm2 (Cdc46/Mcm family)
MSKWNNRLSGEACEVLQEFYLKLRRENKTPEGTPITTRQLEALIRLAEARAKLECQELVTANHARVRLPLRHSPSTHTLFTVISHSL